MSTRYPTKFAPADWHMSNHVVASSAERQQSIARDVREQSKRVQNETGQLGYFLNETLDLYNKTCFDTDNKTRWTQHSTNTNLDGRIRDISDWKETLTRTLADTDNEIEKVIEIIS